MLRFAKTVLNVLISQTNACLGEQIITNPLNYFGLIKILIVNKLVVQNI